MPRYILTVRACNAPKSRGGCYRRPVTIRILDTASGPGEWHWVRQGVVRHWPNVDSRYNGPRSAYGQAMQAAQEALQAMNAPAEQQAA